MTRKTSAEGKRAQEAAKKLSKRCIAQARSGHLKLASKTLYEGIRTWLHRNKLGKKGTSRGQAGETELRRAAATLLAMCVEFQVPPPLRLLEAFELLLNVRPDGIGIEWDMISLAAGYPTIADVPTGKLAAAGVTTKPGAPKPKTIDLNTARSRKSRAEFLEKVQEAKDRKSEPHRFKWQQARLAAKIEATQFEGLLDCVRRAAKVPKRG